MFSTILVALASSAVVIAAPGVTVSFSGAKEITDVDNFKVVATVTNTGSETLNLLNDPNSLLTPSYKTDSFRLSTAKGAVPAFKGVAVKYSAKSAATNKAYTTFAPGQSLDFTHTLGGVYNFSSSGASTYLIAPSAQAELFTHVDAAGELTTLRAEVVDVHTAKVSGKLSPASYVGPSASALSKRSAAAHSFVSCTSAEQTKLNTAAVNAQTYAANAYSYLVGISATTTRFVTWFGTYTAAHKTTVQSHYSKISNGQLATDTFDCTCTDADTYAYVYPDTFGYIYLCGYYWNAPATGTDSQAGTLVHESSHFTTNGATQDYVYGQTAAKSLAKSNSAEAIENADSHEYFAENNPSQS